MTSPAAATRALIHETEPNDARSHPEPAFQEAQEWIEAVTGRSFGDKGFRSGLENGILLCELLSAIKPGLVKKINRLPTPIAGLDNLTVFLRGCEELGLKGAQLFDPGDLQDTSIRANLKDADCNRKLKNVLNTVFWLGKAANSCTSYSGPTLNLKESVKWAGTAVHTRSMSMSDMPAEDEEEAGHHLARWKNRRRSASHELIKKEEERKRIERRMKENGMDSGKRKSIKTYREITPEEAAIVLQRYALRFTISDATLDSLKLPRSTSPNTTPVDQQDQQEQEHHHPSETEPEPRHHPPEPHRMTEQHREPEENAEIPQVESSPTPPPSSSSSPAGPVSRTRPSPPPRPPPTKPRPPPSEPQQQREEQQQQPQPPQVEPKMTPPPTPPGTTKEAPWTHTKNPLPQPHAARVQRDSAQTVRIIHHVTATPYPPSKPVPLLTAKPYCLPGNSQGARKSVLLDGLVRLNGGMKEELKPPSSPSSPSSPLPSPVEKKEAPVSIAPPLSPKKEIEEPASSSPAPQTPEEKTDPVSSSPPRSTEEEKELASSANPPFSPEEKKEEPVSSSSSAAPPQSPKQEKEALVSSSSSSAGPPQSPKQEKEVPVSSSSSAPPQSPKQEKEVPVSSSSSPPQSPKQEKEVPVSSSSSAPPQSPKQEKEEYEYE
ncbi:hypothetical protein CRUP_003114 [Coryphaenoides rupestris]|nr:hypothetical protein CRUP_003114 [Coryphaenoides rupestris]